MAAILVDYENVYATQGLKGAEYLNSGDILYIFYSQCCAKIRAEYMDAIEKAGCGFRVYKLKNAGKNALDFYIAAECGALEQRGETQIAIISKDKGYKAVSDFLKMKAATGTMTIVIAATIEAGLITLNAPEDAARRSALHKKMKMLDIAVEQAKYMERNLVRNRLKEILSGTKYEPMVSGIFAYADANRDSAPRQLYTGSLHHFGRKDGAEIYRILKKVI